MSAPAILAAGAGAALAAGLVLIITALRTGTVRPPALVGPAPRWRRRLRAVHAASLAPGRSRIQQWRRAGSWAAAGVLVWVVSGWPVAGVALIVVGLWLPWLLGSARVVQDRIARLEALETWCRRMADTLTGGGAIGLAQAVTVTAPHLDESIGPAVRVLSRQLREGHDIGASLREFADAVDDRVGDTVAAALLLALHQQTTGAARVLRQLAEGVARDVRARREIEAARAESRQSIRMLLLIQAGLLVLLALVPGFAAPYRTSTGQLVMAVLLAGTVAVLVWMRRLAVGRRASRFLVTPAGPR
ncbi:type II secretion system F family protein [Pseudonocardia lacus]|uniref:type II secretion system F family protein n=1 Tax=Pseudonocardia lacus TaxID=2835865 RepID=UPI001BDC56C8|nr:type II secretion system F family protein [Pseudonocardia lacus]